MQSNPYIYPSVPFFDLSKKIFTDTLWQSNATTIDNVKKLLSSQILIRPTIQGTTPEEKILSIFLSDEVRFGPSEYVEDEKNEWLKRLNTFVTQRRPISLTILGFPFKIPVPLKTNRTLPDLGEIMALQKLYQIASLVREVYSLGAQITIFTERCFASIDGVSTEEALRYAAFLQKMSSHLEWDQSLYFYDLQNIEAIIPDFNQRYSEKIQEYQSFYNRKDPSFLEKFNGTFTSMYRIVTTRGVPLEILMDVYNDSLNDTELSLEAREVREDVRRRATKGVFKYLAYLRVRDDVGFLQRVRPGSLPLTVSPKKGRLGIVPINTFCTRLPYHGVPLLTTTTQRLSIEYLIDMQRDSTQYRSVYLDCDEESLPFYYTT